MSDSTLSWNTFTTDAAHANGDVELKRRQLRAWQSNSTTTASRRHQRSAEETERRLKLARPGPSLEGGRDEESASAAEKAGSTLPSATADARSTASKTVNVVPR
ncbi:MAG: hypothetical protein U0746_21315 [Gemmataceae bacterium]